MSRGVSLKESFAVHDWKIETKAGKFGSSYLWEWTERESSFLFPPLFSWEESQSSCFEIREAGFLYRGLFSKVTLIFN